MMQVQKPDNFIIYHLVDNTGVLNFIAVMSFSLIYSLNEERYSSEEHGGSLDCVGAYCGLSVYLRNIISFAVL